MEDVLSRIEVQQGQAAAVDVLDDRIAALYDWFERTDAALAQLQAQQVTMERALTASAARTDDLIRRIDAGEFVGNIDRMFIEAAACIPRLTS